MKRAFLFLLAVLALPAAAQDWTTIPLGTTADLHDVWHAGGGHSGLGYVVGDGGFVASSPDNLTWTPESVGTSADLRSIVQPSGGQVWVSGAAGTVRLRDGLGNWNSLNIPDADETYVLSSGASGEAVAHGTGGSIWKFVFDWTLEHSAGVPLRAGYSSSFSVGDGGTILKSVDGGLTWTPKPSGTTADLHGIFAGGTGQYLVVGENGTILMSIDNGETWSPRLSGTTRTLRAVHAWGNARFVAVGDDGTMVRSSGSGDVWCRYDPGTTADLFGVQVNGLTHIQAVGENGVFRQTLTGGGDCTPAVDATITRVGSGNVPATGGPVTFTVTLQNTTPEAQTFEAWVDAIIPGGSTFGPFVGPQTVTLNVGQSVGPVSFTRQVPGNAPPGTYTVRLRVGAHPEALLLDESTFTFTKDASGPGEAAAGAMMPADWDGDGSFLAVAEAGTAAPAGYVLSSVRPNPARGQVALILTVDRTQPVTAAVFDVRGRRVASVFDGDVLAGEAVTLALDARGLAPGVYVVRVQGEAFAASRRLVVVR
jgi:photosystem II stability/assembly factor-like uncharacterized protein